MAAGWSWRLFLCAAAVLAIGYLALRLRLVVVPLAVAIAVAGVLSSPMGWLRAHRVPRTPAALLLLLATVLVAVGLPAAILTATADQFAELGPRASQGVTRLLDYAGDLGLSRTALDDLRSQAQEALNNNRERLVSGAISGATLVAELLAGALLVLALVFFFLRDGDRMWGWFLGRLPLRRRAAWDRGGKAASKTAEDYLRGTALVATVDAVFIGLGLVVLDVPLVIPLAMITFLGAFIPVIGAFAAGLLAVLVALVTGGVGTALAVLGVVVVVQQIEGNVLQPFVMGRTLSLHPVVILVVFAAGGTLLGLLGALFAVPIAAIIWNAYTAVRRFPPDREVEAASQVDPALHEQDPAQPEPEVVTR